MLKKEQEERQKKINLQQEKPERTVKVYRRDQVFDAPLGDVPNMLKNGWKRVGF